MKMYFICLFVLELSLVDYRMKNYSNELIALSTIYLVKRLHHEKNYLLESPYDEFEIKNCAI